MAESRLVRYRDLLGPRSIKVVDRVPDGRRGDAVSRPGEVWSSRSHTAHGSADLDATLPLREPADDRTFLEAGRRPPDPIPSGHRASVIGNSHWLL
ncbi:hypothetical protein GCM10009527_076290 [Actinomadura nitritigenes]